MIICTELHIYRGVATPCYLEDNKTITTLLVCSYFAFWPFSSLCLLLIPCRTLRNIRRYSTGPRPKKMGLSLPSTQGVTTLMRYVVPSSYQLSYSLVISINLALAMRTYPCIIYISKVRNADLRSFTSEAIPGTIPHGQNSPRNVRFGLYAEQMTATAFVAPRHCNKKAWLYRVRPAVAHQGFVSLSCSSFWMLALTSIADRAPR